MILQANIGGFQGSPASAFGYIDTDSQTLYINTVTKLVSTRFVANDGEQAGLISNQPTDDYDCFFSEQNFKQAFLDYRYYANSDKLVFESSAKRATPRVEIDQIRESGTTLSISPDTTNEQIAVLALCFFAHQVTEAEHVNNLYDVIRLDNLN